MQTAWRVIQVFLPSSSSQFGKRSDAARRQMKNDEAKSSVRDRKNDNRDLICAHDVPPSYGLHSSPLA
jgi:hypothetical protein